MKTRNGFVSNSSSSSFLVNYKHNKKITLNETDRTKIEAYGFKKTNSFSATSLEYKSSNEELIDSNGKILPINYGYSVSCNQDEVIRFLLKNNIGFTAVCHYGDYNVFFEKDSKYIHFVNNIGHMLEWHDASPENRTLEEKIKENIEDVYKKVKKEEFIKETDFLEEE